MVQGAGVRPVPVVGYATPQLSYIRGACMRSEVSGVSGIGI